MPFCSGSDTDGLCHGGIASVAEDAPVQIHAMACCQGFTFEKLKRTPPVSEPLSPEGTGPNPPGKKEAFRQIDIWVT
jgi:hypothetical protein